ncbi:hypothetical protein [Wielerella bovis]|uniref:hypothetical protein n=1 Tax=Wielerella bovis TaxID=2917790 RepID=UPI0020186808|nr:hypothetical protein [Wielerella bovis]ULJ61704.1 hypothetical protein MIS46_06755 [Wielerella bovis]ULJ63830.1 hypothetical protein MIS33_06550 [Wielerella bovis]ULJ66002.1 hypothetical protein MIS31_06885 [Wielerella bovis]
MKKNKITVELLEKVISVLGEESKINESLREKIDNVISILILMKNDDDCWLTLCPFNYGYIGETFYTSLQIISENNKDAFDEYYFNRIFLFSIRFLREAMISLQRKHLFNYQNLYDSHDFQAIWKKFKTLTTDYVADAGLKKDLLYIQNELDYQILNHYLGGKEFQAMADFDENIKKAKNQVHELENLIQTFRQELESLIDKTNNEANAKIQEVQRLETSLKTYKEGFNFVGLSNGFSKLLEKKETSKNCIF